MAMNETAPVTKGDLHHLEALTDSRFSALETHTDSRFSALETHTDSRFLAVETRQKEMREDIRAVDERSEKRDSKLQSDIRGLTCMMMGLFGGLSTTLAGIIATGLLGN